MDELYGELVKLITRDHDEPRILLTAAVEHPDYRVRAKAAGYCCLSRDCSLRPLMRRLLRDKALPVQRNAASALGYVGDSTDAEQLVELGKHTKDGPLLLAIADSLYSLQDLRCCDVIGRLTMIRLKSHEKDVLARLTNDIQKRMKPRS